jgi:hypothetical protein
MLKLKSYDGEKTITTYDNLIGIDREYIYFADLFAKENGVPVVYKYLRSEYYVVLDNGKTIYFADNGEIYSNLNKEIEAMENNIKYNLDMAGFYKLEGNNEMYKHHMKELTLCEEEAQKLKEKMQKFKSN